MAVTIINLCLTCIQTVIAFLTYITNPPPAKPEEPPKREEKQPQKKDSPTELRKPARKESQAPVCKPQTGTLYSLTSAVFADREKAEAMEKAILSAGYRPRVMSGSNENGYAYFITIDLGQDLGIALRLESELSAKGVPMKLTIAEHDRDCK